MVNDDSSGCCSYSCLRTRVSSCHDTAEEDGITLHQEKLKLLSISFRNKLNRDNKENEALSKIPIFL